MANLENIINFEPLMRLNKDLRKAALTLSPSEIRYLVDSYYQIQEYRKVAGNQIRAMKEIGEPNSLVQWIFDNMHNLEKDIKSALDIYTDNDPVGRWSKSICGIGPVISAGLLAHIDITKAPTVGHIWSFAGLNNEVEWLGAERAKAIIKEVVGNAKEITNEHIQAIAVITHRKPENIMRQAFDEDKGKITKKKLEETLARRPWNARLKTLCWKIGESFVKVCNNPKDFYGHIYLERKALEQRRNENGEYAEQAEEKLRKFRIGKDTEAYKWYSQGKLPPAHIHERAKRYAVKLFLAHWHAVAYKNHYGVEPPKPYAIAILGHAHEIKIPG